MNAVLVKRCVVAGKAYAVTNAGDPQRRALAVALLGIDGWKVATADSVVGVRLDQRQAIALMMRSAIVAAPKNNN